MNIPDFVQFFLHLMVVGSLIRVFTYLYPDTRVAHWLAFTY